MENVFSRRLEFDNAWDQPANDLEAEWEQTKTTSRLTENDLL